MWLGRLSRLGKETRLALLAMRRHQRVFLPGYLRIVKQKNLSQTENTPAGLSLKDGLTNLN